jgi:CRISPR-associated protein Csb2
MGTMPIGRDRQARQFPVAIPDDPVVQFIWPGADHGDTHRQALSELCRYVTYVGHSSSLVQTWIIDSPAKPTRVPGERLTGEPMRVPYAGRLRDLEEQVSDLGHPAGYAWANYQPEVEVESREAVIQSVFDDRLLILRKTKGEPLGLESTLVATEALRGAVLSHCAAPIPEWVSGHRENGGASEQPHVAFIPLPHVERSYADGHLLGLGLALPRGVSADDQRRCLGNLLFGPRSVPRSLSLTFGRLGEWQVELDNSDDRPQALCPETWTGPATTWVTVTPIVFDKHPKAKDPVAAAVEAEEIVAVACARIGLPRPERIVLSPVSMFAGVPHARRFPYMLRKSGGNRHHTHAVLVFAERVSGPLLLGAGRYRGYGMCRPLREGRS